MNPAVFKRSYVAAESGHKGSFDVGVDDGCEDGAKGAPFGVICGLRQPLHLDQDYSYIPVQDS